MKIIIHKTMKGCKETIRINYIYTVNSIRLGNYIFLSTLEKRLKE